MNNIAVLKIKGFFKLCWVRSVQIIRETVRVGKDLNLRFSMFAHTYIHNIGTLVANYLRIRNNSMRLWDIWDVLTLNTNNLGTSMKPDITLVV
jgi:hypothetical protein